MGVFRRTEKAVVRAMCGAKLADRKNTEDIMALLGLNQIIDKMAKASGVRWLRHVLREEVGDVVRNALEQCFSTPSSRKGVDESAQHTGAVSCRVKKRI